MPSFPTGNRPQLRGPLAADKLPPLIVKGRWVIKGGFVDKLCQDVALIAREFRAQPHGRHSAELQRVLNRMRSEPFDRWFTQSIHARSARLKGWAGP